MTCRELIEFLHDYLQRELPAGQQEVFDNHLAGCPACRNYLAGYEQSVRLGKAALSPADAPEPPPVPEELLAAVLAARRREPR